MGMTLLHQLRQHALSRPNVAAFVHGPRDVDQITWAALVRAVDSVANRLTGSRLSGSQAVGDPAEGGTGPATAEFPTLLLSMPNCWQFAAWFLGGLVAGWRVFPVSPNLTGPELQAAAAQSKARAIAGTEIGRSALAGIVDCAFAHEEVLATESSTAMVELSASAALLLHSSGSTGAPKIVLRDSRSLDAVAQAMAESVGFGREDRVLACVPLCHSYGIEHGLLAPLWAGSTVRLCCGFDLPIVLAELQGGATLFPGVPFIYETLARQASGQRFEALRRAYSAGGPLPEAVRDQCRWHLGLVVTQLYGATEIGSVTYSDPTLPGFDAASVGRPMRGVEIRILPEEAVNADNPLTAGETGQVAIRADSMFDGYLDGSPATLLDGFFLTGDLGRLDAYGNLALKGRLKLLIDIAGLKVNPLEVEAALCTHASVADCAVVPFAVTETVSRLKAVVVRRPGDPIEGEALRQYLKARLAPHKVPRVFEFRESLPRSSAGKVMRQQL